MRNKGKLGTLKPNVLVRSSINPINPIAKIAVRLPSMLLESQISPKLFAKCLILNFFHQSFLSLNAYDQAVRRDLINRRLKLTS